MEAATLVASFARFIRFILESSRNNLVPLDNEIEAINIFLDLQKVRFPGLFSHTVKIDIDEDPSEVLVPPLIVQPFVENSVIHGFPKDRNDGEILIHFFKENGNLCCRVKDNGIGIETSSQKKEGTNKSLATQITTERLDLINKRFKCNASLRYEPASNNEPGTSVLITLPLLFNDFDS
jgi:LytS/YehU family sensor histidine kinase